MHPFLFSLYHISLNHKRQIADFVRLATSWTVACFLHPFDQAVAAENVAALRLHRLREQIRADQALIALKLRERAFGCTVAIASSLRKLSTVWDGDVGDRVDWIRTLSMGNL